MSKPNDSKISNTGASASAEQVLTIQNQDCPDWCQNGPDCSWSAYPDHKVRFHHREVEQEELVGEFSTADGPGDFSISMEITACERLAVDWERAAIERRVEPPKVWVGYETREPADSRTGERPEWTSGWSGYTVEQCREIAARFLSAADRLEGILNSAAAA